MGLCLCPQLVFPSQKVFKEEVLPDLVEKIKPFYVLSLCMIAYLPQQHLIFGCQLVRMMFLP
jgi:hypothetical protein